MIDQTVERLQRLASNDAAVAPLAWLQIEALRACTDSAWDTSVSAFEPGLREGLPLLDGVTLFVDRAALSGLWRSLAEVAQRHNPGEVQPLLRADAPGFDLLETLAASVANDGDRLQEAAAAMSVDAALLVTLAHLAALPLLQACGRKAAAALSGDKWQHGYCPVCGAWPTLAELRGLERERWLRCGRCGTGWTFRHQVCAFCGNSDHDTQGYLAAENDRDTRRAEFCDRCGGFLKTLATLGPLSPEEILIQDLTTVELDLAALDREYARPERPGFALRVDIRPAPDPDGSIPWRA